jgi:hypothetical protein
MDIDISDDLQDLLERMELDGRFDDADTITRAALEIARLRGGDDPAFKPTLTAPEKEAVSEACDEGRWWPKDYHHIHTLRELLARMS